MKKSAKLTPLANKNVRVLAKADIAHVSGGEDDGSSGPDGCDPLGIRHKGIVIKG